MPALEATVSHSRLNAQPDSTLDQVQIPKAAQIVASRIRRRIVDGDLRCGDRLASEAELASVFAVSRPVVREALRVLECERLIELARGSRQGARVRDPSAEIVTRATGIALRMKRATLVDVFDARAVNEPAAARFAAQHRPKEAAKSLGRYVAYQLSVIDDETTIRRSHVGFHRLLLEECGNTTLAVTGLALQKVVETHLDLIREQQPSTYSRKSCLWCVHSHRHLTDLIERQEGSEAEAHWRLYLNTISRYWIQRASQSSILQILD